MTALASRIHGGMGVPSVVAREGYRDTPARISAEKVNVVNLLPVIHCEVLHGIDYLRVAAELIRLVLPGHVSDYRRAQMVAQATDISFATVERILAYKREALKSIKVEYLVTLFRLATRNGFDVFAIPGVREVHDAIFGVKS